MSVGAIEAGRAFVRLMTDDVQLTKGLRAARQKLSAFGKSAAGLGAKMFAGAATLTAPLLAAVGHYTSAGAAANKLSQQTGASVESITRLNHAAKQTGVDTDDLVGSIEELQVRMGEAAQDGTGPLAEGLAKLGMDAKDLVGIPIDKRIGLIADALGGLADESDRQFLTDEIFGGDGFKIMPLLAQGSAGIKALGEEADALGLTMTGPQAKAAAKFGATWRGVKASLSGVAMTAAAELLPMLQDLATNALRISRALVTWIKENSGLVKTLALVAAGLAIGGSALIAFGLAASGAAQLIGLFMGAIAMVKAVVVTLMSPLGLVLGLLAGLSAWFLMATDTGRAMTAGLAEAFGFLKGIAIDAFGGIKDALSAGDFELAGKILWLSLKVVWKAGTLELTKLWNGWLSGIRDTFFKVMDSIKSMWSKTVTKLSNGMIRAQGLIDKDLDVDGAIAESNAMGARRERGFDRDRANREASQNTAVGDAEADLAKTQAEFRAAIAQANQQAADADGPDFGADRKGAFDLKAQMAALAAQANAGKASASVVGSFSGESFRGTAGGMNHAAVTAKATQETAVNTSAMLVDLRKTRLGGAQMVFQ